MIKKLLYMTYISMKNTPGSGSSVRPQKMKMALEELGLEVKTFDGADNHLQIRKKTVGEVKELLKNWRPDACYIEPPPGPMFYSGDVELIRQLHRMRIPIAIFYRDAYWKYPEYYIGKDTLLIGRMKHQVIKIMQIHQWKVFRDNIDIIYFPSQTMAKEFVCPYKDVLPPGGFITDATEKKELSNPLQFIFVGGAAENYGTFLTINAFEEVNRSGVRAKLFYICPKEQWDGIGIQKELFKDWLDVVHISGDENLKSYYEKADVALLTAPRTFYRDFAVPVKIFEYMSYLKPMLVTNCKETARVVNDNRVGWVVQDTVESIAEQIAYLCANSDEITKVKGQMETARSNNLWISRARKVINDLEKKQEEQ